MKLGQAVRELAGAELDLAAQYRTLGERHAAEHDVFHMTATLARQCEAHAEALGSVEQGEREEGAARTRRTASELLGRSPDAAPLLLDDLRALYLSTSDVHIRWLIVGQGAKAARDKELMAVFETACEETTGQMRWLTTKIKTAAPQVLSVG
jgi:ferritin-like metal-binding protein YciE